MSKTLWAIIAVLAVAVTVSGQTRPAVPASKTEPTIAELTAIIEYQRKQIAELTIRVDQLERQLVATSQPNPVFSGNIVANGDFETPSAGATFVLCEPGKTLDGWTVAITWVDLISTASGKASSGNQSVDLSGGSAGQIYQELVTVPGQTYELRFAMAGGGVIEQQEPKIKKMQVHWGETLVDTPSFDITGHTLTNMGWTYHTYRVKAVSTKTQLKFTSLTNTQWGPMIDNVSVVLVGLPATATAPSSRPNPVARAQAATQP